MSYNHMIEIGRIPPFPAHEAITTSQRFGEKHEVNCGEVPAGVVIIYWTYMENIWNYVWKYMENIWTYVYISIYFHVCPWTYLWTYMEIERNI